MTASAAIASTDARECQFDEPRSIRIACAQLLYRQGLSAQIPSEALRLDQAFTEPAAQEKTLLDTRMK